MTIEHLVRDLKLQWSQPRFNSKSDPNRLDFKLVCRFAHTGLSSAQIRQIMGEIHEGIKKFWQVVQWAELFKDEIFGQWGLRILTPEESVRESVKQKAERAKEFRDGDLVVGYFFGDSELLLVRSLKEEPDFGIVLIALPIDPRPYWPVVASSFEEFLVKYAAAEGEKFWEDSGFGK